MTFILEPYVLDAYAAAVAACRVPLHDEAAAQDALFEALRGRRFTIEREVRLGPGERVDFLLAGCIALEVKVKRAWSKPGVLRQLRRYAAHERVAGLVLASNLAMHLPPEIEGKPALAVSLGRAWL